MILPYDLLGKFIHVLETEGFPPVNHSGAYFANFCHNNGVPAPIPKNIINAKDMFMRGIKNKRVPYWVKNDPQLLAKYQKLITMYHTVYKPQIMHFNNNDEDSAARTRPVQWASLFAGGTAVINENSLKLCFEPPEEDMPHLFASNQTMEERLMEMVNNEIEQNASDPNSELFKQNKDPETIEQLQEFIKSRADIIQNQGNALREANIKLEDANKQIVNYKTIINNKSKAVESLSKELQVIKQKNLKILQDNNKTINYQRIKIQQLETVLGHSNSTGTPRKIIIRRTPKTNLVPSQPPVWLVNQIKVEPSISTSVSIPSPTEEAAVEVVELE